MRMPVARAADILLGGGVVTLPTEGVFGLSCMPDDEAALLRLLAIKQRDPSKGLILIGSSRDQFAPWIADDAPPIPDPDPAQPTTWIVPAATGVSTLLRGTHPSLAVRITTNPIARAVCEAVDSPLVSTSANLSGEPTARNRYLLRRKFRGCVDYIVPGDCGPAAGASEIRDLRTGKVLRPGSQ